MIETDESHPLPHAYLVSTSLDVARIQRTLILGMDGSENADFAFEWTLKNILRPGDHLILVQVYPTADAVDLYSLTGDWTAELKRSVEHQVRCYLRIDGNARLIISFNGHRSRKCTKSTLAKSPNSFSSTLSLPLSKLGSQETRFANW